MAACDVENEGLVQQMQLMNRILQLSTSALPLGPQACLWCTEALASPKNSASPNRPNFRAGVHLIISFADTLVINMKYIILEVEVYNVHTGFLRFNTP